MISEIIEKWIKGILIDGITGNLSGLFDNVNAKVGEIASDVGSTPQAWNSGIFNMLRSLSETVVLPIAAAILALVMCHELIQMITEKNNISLYLEERWTWQLTGCCVQRSFCVTYARNSSMIFWTALQVSSNEISFA